MSQIYVDSATPAADVEGFITDFKIDENFKPLSRMLRRYSKRLVNEDLAGATPPAAFVTGNWAVVLHAENGLSVTISTLPANGGSALTSVQTRYRIGGVETPVWSEWATHSATTDAKLLSAEIVDGEGDVEIRAVNAIGASATDAKTYGEG